MNVDSRTHCVGRRAELLGIWVVYPARSGDVLSIWAY